MSTFLTGGFKLQAGRKEGSDALYDGYVPSMYVEDDTSVTLIKVLGAGDTPLLADGSYVRASGQAERAHSVGAQYGMILSVADTQACFERISAALAASLHAKFTFTGYVHNVSWGMEATDPPILKLELENYEGMFNHCAGYVYASLPDDDLDLDIL